MRLFGRAQPNVGKLRRKGDLAGLREAARFRADVVEPGSESWDHGAPVRIEALEALSEFYGPVVGDGVIDALCDPSPEVRAAAVRATGTARPARGVDALLDGVATWEIPPFGYAVRHALDELASWDATEVPERLATRLIGLEQGALGERHQEALLELIVADSRGPERSSREVGDVLVTAVTSGPTPGGREQAAEMIGWIGSACEDPLVEAVENGRAGPAAVKAVGRLGDARAIHSLTAYLEHDEPELRTAAAYALGKMDDTRAVVPLLSATRDADRGVRQTAKAALNGLGAAGVIVAMVALDRPSGESAEDSHGWAELALNRLLSAGD